jgi:Icc-related predicted phosphoesterase
MKVFTRLFLALVAGGFFLSSAHAQSQPVALDLKASIPFHFVAFGDTRFHDPADTQPANPEIRHALVTAIAGENPAFISIGGDIVLDGDSVKDWEVWDAETSLWRERKIPVYPALGNHDVHGNLDTALANYYQRFPDIQKNLFYSARVANSLMLVLDSNIDELTGPQGAWLTVQLDHLPADVDFVFFVFHHPPYTSSSDNKIYGGGHSARPAEQAFAKMIEDRQQRTRARFIVFNGHVHNYERHEHGGVTYFVTGGGGARPYLIPRAPDDPYKDMGINYHYLLVEVDHTATKITMHKVEIKDGSPVWTTPDTVTIRVPAAAAAKAAAGKAH